MAERTPNDGGAWQDPGARELAHLLERLTREHAHLLALADRRATALARADIRDLRECVVSENDAVQRIAAIDKDRAALAARLASRFGIDAPGGVVTISALGAGFDEHDRERLARLTTSLRALIERVRAVNDASRDAADTLATHMRGVIRTVEHKLSTSGAYGPTGEVRAGPAAINVMDLTS